MKSTSKTALKNRRTTTTKIKRADELRRKCVSDGIKTKNMTDYWIKKSNEICKKDPKKSDEYDIAG